MIDTIHLRLFNPLTSHLHRIDMQTAQIVDGRLKSTAMAPQPDVGIPAQLPHLKYCPSSKLYYVRGSRGFIYVQLHLPKWKSRGGWNVWPATKDEAWQIFQELQGRLKSIGIVTDIFKAAVVRLDIFSNGVTEYSYQDFKPLLDTLDIPRRRRVIYPDSIRFESGRRVDIIYDKREQQSASGYSAELLPPNLIRWEYRLLQKDAVSSTTGVDILEDLFTEWEAIEELYIRNLKAALRYDEVSPGQIMLSKDIAFLVKNRHQVSRALYSKRVLEETGDIGSLRTILKQNGTTRLQAYRLVQTVLDGLQYPIPSDSVSINALKMELYNKLVQGLGEVPEETL